MSCAMADCAENVEHNLEIQKERLALIVPIFVRMLMKAMPECLYNSLLATHLSSIYNPINSSITVYSPLNCD